MPRSRFLRLALPILGALAIVYLWLALGSAFMLMPPPLAIVWIAIVAAAFLWVHGYREGVRDHARRVVRLRPLGSAARWIILAIPPMLLFHTFFLVIYLGMTGIPDPTPNPFERYLARPGGWWALALFLGVTVPIIEEFGVRGWIQRPLERRLGAKSAIALTAIIFAVAHFQLLGLPTRFFAGVFFGYAVWVTRSIWAAVILHGAHNLSLVLSAVVSPERDAPPEPPGAAMLILSAVGLVAMTIVLVNIARRLLEERRLAQDSVPTPTATPSDRAEPQTDPTSTGSRNAKE